MCYSNVSNQFQSRWESSKATTVELANTSILALQTTTARCRASLSIGKGFWTGSTDFSQCLLGRKTGVELFTSLYSWIHWHCHKVVFSFFHKLLHLPALEQFVCVVTLLLCNLQRSIFFQRKESLWIYDGGSSSLTIQSVWEMQKLKNHPCKEVMSLFKFHQVRNLILVVKSH